MGDNKSGPEEAVQGVVEGVKGKAKEAAGAVAGRDDLKQEGQAQQDKADAQRDAAKKEAEAESGAVAPRPPKSARRKTSSSPREMGPVRTMRTGPLTLRTTGRFLPVAAGNGSLVGAMRSQLGSP